MEFLCTWKANIDELMQVLRCNSIGYTLELRLSCNNHQQASGWPILPGLFLRLPGNSLPLGRLGCDSSSVNFKHNLEIDILGIHVNITL